MKSGMQLRRWVFVPILAAAVVVVVIVVVVAVAVVINMNTQTNALIQSNFIHIPKSGCQIMAAPESRIRRSQRGILKATGRKKES